MAKIQAKSVDYEAESNESETVCQPQNQTQNLLPVREWGFKSLHPHHFRSIAYCPIAGIRALVDNGIRTSLSFPSFRITRVLDALPPRPGDDENRPRASRISSTVRTRAGSTIP